MKNPVEIKTGQSDRRGQTPQERFCLHADKKQEGKMLDPLPCKLSP